MKSYLLIIFLFILNHCSFDNKTGIWENSSRAQLENDNKFKDFQTLSSNQQLFRSIINPASNLEIIIEPPEKNNFWKDEFYSSSNNLKNFIYKDENRIIFKSKKLSRYIINNQILFDGKNVIANDIKGNLIFYSIKNQQKIYTYNFYKKRFKKIEKKLNKIIEDNIIYVIDNVGYFYALNYETKKLLWAKNFKIPFRSNLKIIGNKIITSDQNNVLYILDKSNGEMIKSIPTEETVLKNNFVNSISANQNTFFYLNTFGSLYSINNDNSINWFINLNQSLEENANIVFYSNPLISHNNKIIISSSPFLYIVDSNNGSTIYKKAISSIEKPIVSKNNLFLITKDNYLVCIDLLKGEIIYSIDISDKIANFLDTKKKDIIIKTFAIINNKLSIFLDNSYVVTFNTNGIIEKINKFKNKLVKNPIFINDSILYLTKKNKLIILN